MFVLFSTIITPLKLKLIELYHKKGVFNNLSHFYIIYLELTKTIYNFTICLPVHIHFLTQTKIE